MKKNKFRKALLKVLFSCFCCAFTLGVATACKNNTPDTSSNSGAIVETLDIVDWEDETAEGVLGNCWDVEILKAFDAVGKEYPVNITVKKLANGAEIPLIYNAFDLLSTGGYEIIYTAGSGKDIAIKKITITVKDEVNPVIIVTGNNIAEIGKKYTYPTLNVNDDSGEACNVKVKVFNEKDELVESDATGFVPAEVGYYTLLIEAFDAGNNSNSKTFEVYARNSIGIGEIDSFDDEGLQYTARVDTVYGEYTSFKHLSTSKGSAMFASSKAITTDVYVIPRIKAADLKGIDGDLCITISLYINDSSAEKKEVTVGTTKFDIETNKWTYLYVTEDDVSDIARFVTDLRHETKCLLSAQNNGTPYEIFIDDVSVCQKAEMQAVTGLESVYEQGASITFTLADGYALDWYRDGKVAAVASGRKLDVAGKYQAFARPVNEVGAVQMYEFTVGTLRMELQSDVKFAIGADNQLPEVKVYNGKTLVSDAMVTYYDFGLYTGEMTKLEGTVKPEDVKFAIYAEAEVDGKIVSDVMFYTAKYTADAYAYMGEGNGDWVPTDSDFARQYGDYEGAYDNFDIIGNYAYYIESYGAAPSIRFTSLKAYMANKNIPTATIKILFAAPSSVAYDFGEGRSAIHSGVPYKTGELLVFEDVALEDIGHVQIIWVSSEVYVMVELPHHVEIQAQKVAFDLGEVTLKDNSATLFANYSDLTCSVKLPSGEEVAVLDNKFVAEEKGNYRVSYQATNADGKKVLGSYFIRCGYEAKEFGMMWNFDDPTIVENDPQEADNGAYWVNHYEEFEGEKGVVEVVSNYNDYVWEANFLKAGKSLLEKVPADADTLFIKVKGETNFDLTLYAAYTNAIHGDTLVCYSYAVTTDWQTIEITGENFQHFVNHFGSYKNGLAMFLPNGVTMYMSEFYVGKVETASAYVAKGTEVTVPVFNHPKYTIDNVTAPDGSAVELTDGKFYATQKGAYKISYTALNENATLIAGTYTIISYENAKEFGSMWDFSDASIVERDPQEADQGSYWVKHHEELDGEKGVVQVTSNYGDWVWEANFLKAGKSLLEEVPADADTLFIKVKGETNFDLTLYAAYTNANHGDTLVCYSYAVTTEWQTIAITGDNFQHFITYFNSYKNGLAMFLPNGVTMYMSEFYVGMIGEAVPESEVVNATQVTITDNAAILGYEKLSYSVSKANGTPVVVANGKFTADEEGVYVVSYEGLVNNTPVMGSYTILVVNVSNGNWTPVASDWGKQGADAYDNISVLSGVGYRVECNNSACHTRVPSLKEYMQANSLTTVTIKIYCVTNVALGSTLHGHTDTVNYEAGQVVVFEDVDIFEADYYIQSVWSAMTYYVVIDLGI